MAFVNPEFACTPSIIDNKCFQWKNYGQPFLYSCMVKAERISRSALHRVSSQCGSKRFSRLLHSYKFSGEERKLFSLFWAFKHSINYSRLVNTKYILSNKHSKLLLYETRRRWRFFFKFLFFFVNKTRSKNFMIPNSIRNFKIVNIYPK